MNKHLFSIAFILGVLGIIWVGVGFIDNSFLAMAMTAVIGAVYVYGASELRQFRRATSSLAAALAAIPDQLDDIGAWLDKLHPSLQNPVRLRIEGERVGLPGPALTPYLVGLLVMLGMLGTFLGMVVTLKGAVFALEKTTDLQAMRSALSVPVQGLGLAFGTSVAGIAASAMLGLMSAISRRERMQAAQLLDTRIATVLRRFSLAHQRQETFKALQMQSQALPAVVDKLQAMMTQLESTSQQLNQRLIGNQEDFHRDVKGVYTDLARAVDQSLRESLSQSAHTAAESIKPVVEAAMSTITRDAQLMHERVTDTVRMQLDGISARFGDTATSVTATWTAALKSHEQASAGVIANVARSLDAFNTAFEQRSGALVEKVSETYTSLQNAQREQDKQRHQAWTQSLESMATSLAQEWRQAGEQTLSRQREICDSLSGISTRFGDTAASVTDTWTAALKNHKQVSAGVVDNMARSLDAFNAAFEQRSAALVEKIGQTHASLQSAHAEQDAQRQQAWTQSLEAIGASLAQEWRQTGEQTLSRQQQICDSLTRTAQEIAEHAQAGARNTLAETTRLLTGAEELMRSRIAAEAQWLDQHRERMDQLASLLRAELGALRDEEAARGNAAVERLGQLQEEVTGHLTTLGTALEQPIARLIETASEAPRAAAEVIGQMREQISGSVARDNALLEERSRIMETLDALLAAINQAAGEQRAAIDSLVESAGNALNASASAFSENVNAEATKLSEMAAHVTGSAVEVASLAETFGVAVQSFNEANEKLIANLQRIEGAMDKSLSRSDEQLAYYVAQAREIIDLSMTSQKEIVDALCRLPAAQANAAEEVR